ncbi:MAG: hypothetical protein KC613_09480 [Myxococcales bacterium]|nr:hypothetical protein [Myxococcales bacterium]MCB9522501.1 hypothetical protein [Myxococcales bacterium]
MTWLERALYGVILALLGVGLVMMKQQNTELAAQAQASAAQASGGAE